MGDIAWIFALLKDTMSIECRIFPRLDIHVTHAQIPVQISIPFLFSLKLCFPPFHMYHINGFRFIRPILITSFYSGSFSLSLTM